MMAYKWHSRIFKFDSKRLNDKYISAGGGFITIMQKDDKYRRSLERNYRSLIIPNEIEKATYETLFVYMFRRFGIPQKLTDPCKQIAVWHITTPDKNIGLRINPYPSHDLSASFGYIVTTDIYNYRFKPGEDIEEILHLKDMLLQSMMDLLTPVCIRDMTINVTGIIDVDMRKCIKSWKYSGYGVDEKYFKDIVKD